jgi:hypothetical protein
LGEPSLEFTRIFKEIVPLFHQIPGDEQVPVSSRLRAALATVYCS